MNTEICGISVSKQQWQRKPREGLDPHLQFFMFGSTELLVWDKAILVLVFMVKNLSDHFIVVILVFLPVSCFGGLFLEVIRNLLMEIHTDIYCFCSMRKAKSSDTILPVNIDQPAEQKTWEATARDTNWKGLVWAVCRSML